MSSNIMGEKDLSLDFLLSFYPDLLHPYEYLRTTKSGVSKVRKFIFQVYKGRVLSSKKARTIKCSQKTQFVNLVGDTRGISSHDVIIERRCNYFQNAN